jgi:CPA2 family monovalent cation:H+ antiporter-2
VVHPRLRPRRRLRSTASCRARCRPSPRCTSSWVERLRATPQRSGSGPRLRRFLRWLGVDVALLTVLVVAASLLRARIATDLSARLGIAPTVAHLAVLVSAGALSIPLLAGIFRNARGAGTLLAEMALPADEEGKVDLASAPRRVLVVSLQLAVVLVAGLPIVAVPEPFCPASPARWRSRWWWCSSARRCGGAPATFRATCAPGAQVIVEALAAQGAGAPAGEMTEVRELLPGLGEPVTVQLEPESPAVGRTLGELNLRGVTGAAVLAHRPRRRRGSCCRPRARRCARGDRLALAGSQEAIAAARELLVMVRP